jgi:hypothetical protein
VRRILAEELNDLPTIRYKLRTLLLLLAILPPLLAVGWVEYSQWRERERRRALAEQIDRRLQRALDNMRLATPPMPQPIPWQMPVELPAGTIATPGPIEAAQPESP